MPANESAFVAAPSLQELALIKIVADVTPTNTLDFTAFFVPNLLCFELEKLRAARCVTCIDRRSAKLENISIRTRNINRVKCIQNGKKKLRYQED